MDAPTPHPEHRRSAIATEDAAAELVVACPGCETVFDLAAHTDMCPSCERLFTGADLHRLSDVLSCQRCDARSWWHDPTRGLRLCRYHALTGHYILAADG